MNSRNIPQNCIQSFVNECLPCVLISIYFYLQNIYCILYQCIISICILQTFEAMRSVMLQKGNVFLEKMMTARGKIATKGAERLPDGAVNRN